MSSSFEDMSNHVIKQVLMTCLTMSLSATGNCQIIVSRKSARRYIGTQIFLFSKISRNQNQYLEFRELDMSVSRDGELWKINLSVSRDLWELDIISVSRDLRKINISVSQDLWELDILVSRYLREINMSVSRYQ